MFPFSLFFYFQLFRAYHNIHVFVFLSIEAAEMLRLRRRPLALDDVSSCTQTRSAHQHSSRPRKKRTNLAKPIRRRYKQTHQHPSIHESLPHKNEVERRRQRRYVHCVFAPICNGMTPISTTRRFAVPYTLSSGSTTPPLSFGSIAHEPTVSANERSELVPQTRLSTTQRGEAGRRDEEREERRGDAR